MAAGGFYFRQWADVNGLNKEVVNALTREGITDITTLSELVGNDSEIKDLRLSVGDRLRLKKALNCLHKPPLFERSASQDCQQSEEGEYLTIDSDDEYDKGELISPLPTGCKPPIPRTPLNLERKVTERLLLEKGKERSYILRRSSKVKTDSALSFLHGGKVTHYPIKRGHVGYHIGDHEYPDIPSAIQYYSDNPITKEGSRELCLGEPLRLEEKDIIKYCTKF